MTSLLLLAALLVGAVFFLIIQSREAGKNDERIKASEAETKARDKVVKARERLRRDADYAVWVRDRFTRK